MADTMTILDLPGRPGRTKSFVVKSPAQAYRLFRTGKTVSSAGPRGCIDVWCSEDGRYNCEFQCLKVPVAGLNTDKLEHVKAWIEKWWKEMGRD